jgi:rhodanese-related sulfurtransferase
MKKYCWLITLVLLSLLLTIACAEPEEQAPISHIRLTAQEAAEKMTDDALILDVRSPAEFAEGHIPNAILLPHTLINEQAVTLLPDKTQTILVYCRTGNRSAEATKTLLELGYTNVFDFGGIVDWHGAIITNY